MERRSLRLDLHLLRMSRQNLAMSLRPLQTGGVPLRTAPVSQQSARGDAKIPRQHLEPDREETMSVTVRQLLEAMEAQMALHREREAFHAGQEAAHREERARHAAELEKIAAHHESLRESLGAIEGFAAARPTLERGGRPSLTRHVHKAVADLEPDHPFTASELAAEIDRRLGDKLKKPTERNLVGIILRRMRDSGRLRLLRKGRPHTEAVYAHVAGTG